MQMRVGQWLAWVGRGLDPHVSILQEDLMIVCICNRVSDSTIRSCVEQGACSLKDVREALNVGLVCGTCAKYARALVRQCVDERRDREGPMAA